MVLAPRVTTLALPGQGGSCPQLVAPVELVLHDPALPAAAALQSHDTSYVLGSSLNHLQNRRKKFQVR